MQPTDPILTLPKIGPKYKQLLQNLNISTVSDLLYHFPFRYDDFSKIVTVSQAQTGETVTLKVTLGPVNNIFTKYGKRITRAKILDHTGDMDVIWFNQHYLKNTLNTGKTYLFSGRVGEFGGSTTKIKLALIAPEFEEVSAEGELKSLNTGRLVPIYPETAGATSKFLRLRINDVLSRIFDESNKDEFSEFIPDEILLKEKLPNLLKAFSDIHFPKTATQAETARNRFAFEELFLELLKVEKRKAEWGQKKSGHKLVPHQTELTKFIKNLPFKLTDSQQTSLDQILTDMQKSSPMNRLLEGDVGTGKTVVAVVAAYFAHLNGLKTLYMAPTEILAKQHFSTFNTFLGAAKAGIGGKPEQPVQIGLVTGTEKPEKALADHSILIGTHALLFSSEKFKDIGLIVIDEQHRFGVAQRGKLMELAKSEKSTVPHLLTMTATPIPRTLALTLYGDLDISILKTHPNTDRKITTKVVPHSAREKAYEWIRDRVEPTFIVCPFIQQSGAEGLEEVRAAQQLYRELSDGVFGGLKMGLLHGKLKAAEKEKIVNDFRTGKIQILVSTPVIEVGIDVPDATIMVIESAERYGLASLHQLRGRVGRGTKEGFCFVFMTNNSKQGFTRLKNLETVDNGLELAEIDLKLRGQGDVFGIAQHGDNLLKIADINNLELLEKAKRYAEKHYPQLKSFPNLLKKVLERDSGLVGRN